MTRFRTLALLSGLAWPFASANAAFGDLDTAFGTAGLRTTSLTAQGQDRIRSLAIDSLDRILALAYVPTVDGGGAETAARAVILRYTAAGVLDTTFGTAGVLDLASATATSEKFAALAIDGAGNFLLAGRDGSSQVFVTRYTPAGAVDGTFGTGGTGTLAGTPAVSVAAVDVGASGKIVVGATRFVSSFGNECAFIVRFDAGGTPDATFGSGGNATGCTTSFARTAARSIVAGPSGYTLLGGAGFTPGNNLGVYWLAQDNGTFVVLGRSNGNVASATEEASFVTLRFRADASVGLVGHRLAAGEPDALTAVSGRGIENPTGNIADGVETTRDITLPPAWLFAGTYALQSTGAVIIGGAADAGSGNTDAALVRYAGTAGLAESNPATPEVTLGSGALPAATLALLLAGLLARGAVSRRPKRP